MTATRHHRGCVPGEHACYCWCHFRAKPNRTDIAAMDYKDRQARRSMRALRSQMAAKKGGAG